MIAFGAQWAPDVADINSEVVMTATNVLPLGNSYGPALAHVTTTSALPALCVGCFQARRIDGTFAIFAGTATALYLYNQGTDTWTVVTRLAGGAYSVAVGSYWSFVQYRDVVLACNGVDVVQAYTLSSSLNFAALGGSPPLAKYAAVVGPVIVLSGVATVPTTIYWSGLTSETSWTLGTDSAGSQVFLDGGAVYGVAGRETGYVLQADAVRRMVYQATGASVFAFERIEGARGCTAPYSIINVGGVTFYYGATGFNAISGIQSQQIGLDRVNEFFKSVAVPGSIVEMVGAVDPRATRVAWAFKSTSSSASQTFDQFLIYDWGRDKWALTLCSLDYLAFNGLASLGYTLEQLDAFGTMETLYASLDSPAWQGGVPSFGGIDSTHKLGYFNGATLEATVETSEKQLNPPGRAFVSGVTLYGGPAETMIAVGGRETNTDNVSTVYNSEFGIEVDGNAAARCSSRYHRSKVRIPAGSSWTQLVGVDYTYVAEGGR